MALVTVPGCSIQSANVGCIVQSLYNAAGQLLVAHTCSNTLQRFPYIDTYEVLEPSWDTQ